MSEKDASKNTEINITETSEEIPVYEFENGAFAVKDGYSVNDRFIDDDERKRVYDPDPVHVTHNVVMDDTKSLVDFTNEYKTDHTKIFYNNDRIVTIFDYPTAEEPARSDSRATLPLRYTDVFAEFKAIVEGEKLKQKEFVRFLKKAERFIIQPEAATILEIAQSLSASQKVDGVEKNTKRAFTVNIEIKTGKDTLEIPEKLVFKMRPFFCSEQTAEFVVELFIEGGDYGFLVELMPYDLDESLEDCVNKITDDIIEGIEKVPAFRVTEGGLPRNYTPAQLNLNTGFGWVKQ